MATTTTTQPQRTEDIILGKSPYQSEYTLLEVLAENDSGKVEVIKDEAGRKYIRKMRTLGQENGWEVEKLMRREFEFTTQSPHPAFAEMIGYTQTTMNDKIVCTQLKEFIEGKDLGKVIEQSGSLGPETAVQYMLEATEVFSFLHEKERLIRDFKPSQVIVQKPTKKSNTSQRHLRFTDLDSLGTQKQVAGTSGSTMMVGSDHWTHPYGITSGLASVQTDLFALGTTFYYCLTGRKPEQTTSPSGGTTLTNENFSLLEQKVSSYAQGGPELTRTIKKLLEPIPAKQYKSAAELSEDLKQIQTILEHGYDALANQRFRVNQEWAIVKGFKDLTKNGGSIDSAMYEGLSNFLSSAGSLFFGSATRLVLSLGTAASLTTGYISYSYLQHQSETRAVMDFPAVSSERHPILQASAALADTAQDIGGVYVLLTGTSPQQVPNDIKLQQLLQQERGKVEKTKEVLEQAKKSLDPYATSITNIHSGGQRLRRSFVHTSTDNYHTEWYTVPVESCSGSGNTRTCTTHMETRSRQVYDDTDHYWTFTPSIAIEGAKELEDGTDDLRAKHPTAVSYDDLLRNTIPAQDSLGRKISKSDILTYGEGQNEWLKKGMPPKYNALANIDVVLDNRSILAMLEIAQAGFDTHPGYPLRTHVNNTCSSCEDQGAPAGYLHVKDVEYITTAYTRPFGDLHYVFRSAEPELNRLLTELSSLDRRLNSGEKIDANDLLTAADIGTTAYKVMVAKSVIAAPTAGERTWWPIGLGLGGLILTAIAGGIIAYNDNQNSYRRLRYGSGPY